MAMFHQVLLVIFKTIGIMYLVQLIISTISIYNSKKKSMYNKIYIDEYNIEGSSELLITLLQYPIVRAHNNIRGMYYRYYNQNKTLPNIQQILSQIPYSIKYIISGIGRCG
jgi:hypothetical protein